MFSWGGCFCTNCHVFECRQMLRDWIYFHFRLFFFIGWFGNFSHVPTLSTFMLSTRFLPPWLVFLLMSSFLFGFVGPSRSFIPLAPLPSASSLDNPFYGVVSASMSILLTLSLSGFEVFRYLISFSQSWELFGFLPLPAIRTPSFLSLRRTQALHKKTNIFSVVPL